MPTRIFTVPRWRRVVGTALTASPALLATLVALASVAYLVGMGAGDSLLLAGLPGAG